MCGIIAAASNRHVGKLLVQGLHKMEYRGYDSAGIALHQGDKIAHLRALGKVQLLEEKMIAEYQADPAKMTDLLNKIETLTKDLDALPKGRANAQKRRELNSELDQLRKIYSIIL